MSQLQPQRLSSWTFITLQLCLVWNEYCKNINSALQTRSVISLQVLIKPKPVFQTAVVSEQTRQLVTETLQQVTRAAEVGHLLASCSDGATKDEAASFTEASSLAGEASHGSVQGILLFFFFSVAQGHRLHVFCCLHENIDSVNERLLPSFLRNAACSARVVLQRAGLDWAGSISGVRSHYHLSGGDRRGGIPVSDFHYQSSAGAATNYWWAKIPKYK